MPRILIDYKGLASRGIKYSKSQLRRRMAAGKFPKAVNTGEQNARNTWVADEIDAYIEALIAERDQSKAV